MTAETKTSQYLILLRQPHEGPPPTAEQMHEIMAKFTQWMEDLRARGAVVGTNGLEPAGQVLRGRRGVTMSDGPYAETKEIVGGYVLINAASLDHAVELARDCPGLDYRMSVEVRPVKPMRTT